MSNKEFPDNIPDEQENLASDENIVDFSDLGPLFSPEEESTEEANSQAEFIPQGETEQEPEINFEKDASEEACGEEVSFDPEPENQVSFEPQEDSSVDFSDLGPLFHPEEAPVVAGQAAQVLKKLSLLVPDESDSSSQEDIDPENISLDSDQEIFPDEIAEVEEESSEESPSEEPLTPDEQEETASQEEGPEEKTEEIPSEPASFREESPEEVSEMPAEESVSELPEEEKQLPPAYKRPTRKGRPKRKKGEGFFGIPNLLVTVVWIAVTVLIGVTLGRMAWLCAADVLAFGREDKPVTITVYEADTIEDITRKLHESGLIQYPGLFKFYASLAVDEGEIHPGIWDLNTRYDYHALVNMMSPSSSREVIELMIPEGYSCRQIFALMEENKICTSLDLGAYAASGELDDYWFLEGVERGDMYCLEGYLFPDTYQFYKNDSPKNVLTKMLNNFGSRFDEAMTAQIDTLNAHLADLMRQGGHGDEFIAQNQFTVRDVINVASLIEKETSSADEGYVIASVIYNRLFNWPDNVPYLNIDATIVYALGGKNKLTQEDLKVNSPYNTYTHTGLTPGPIANPGLSSIRAALDPAESNYYYYVLDPALGSHRFSTTYDEHKANIASIGG